MRAWQRLGWTVCLLITGCARFPDQAISLETRRIIVDMTVEGEIKSSYYYFVVFNFVPEGTSPPDPGPVPVVRPPWGNGYAAGNFTHFMLYHEPGGFGGFGIYPGSENTEFNDSISRILARPLVMRVEGTNRLHFEFDLIQIEPDKTKACDFNVMQVNFILTDYIPLDPQDPTQKIWDAIGNSQVEESHFININIDRNLTVNNQSFGGPEVPNDVSPRYDPDLDLIDWRIEVRSIGCTQ